MKSMFSRKVIVFLEDDDSIAEIIRTLLIDEGYRIVCGRCLDDLYKILHTILPDLIITDFYLARQQTGNMILKYLKTTKDDKRFRTIPIIFMTAREEADMKGIDKPIIYKPFNLTDLLRIISDTISSS